VAKESLPSRLSSSSIFDDNSSSFSVCARSSDLVIWHSNHREKNMSRIVPDVPFYDTSYRRGGKFSRFTKGEFIVVQELVIPNILLWHPLTAELEAKQTRRKQVSRKQFTSETKGLPTQQIDLPASPWPQHRVMNQKNQKHCYSTLNSTLTSSTKVYKHGESLPGVQARSLRHQRPPHQEQNQPQSHRHLLVCAGESEWSIVTQMNLSYRLLKNKLSKDALYVLD